MPHAVHAVILALSAVVVTALLLPSGSHRRAVSGLREAASQDRIVQRATERAAAELGGPVSPAASSSSRGA